MDRGPIEINFLGEQFEQYRCSLFDVMRWGLDIGEKKTPFQNLIGVLVKEISMAKFFFIILEIITDTSVDIYWA